MTAPAITHFDGDARLPDTAIGYTVEVDGATEERAHNRIGTATCNEAEYHALHRGGEVASQKGCTEVEVRSGSQLIVRQIRENWQAKEQHLREIRDCVRELADEFEHLER